MWQRLRDWFTRTGSETLGWTFVLLGLLMLLLPGPGLLTIVAGVALLSRHYEWAELMLEPLHRRAVDGAIYGVATIPRIIMSFLGVFAIAFVGWVWWSSPRIPEFSILGVGFGPELPAAGWVGALGIWFSAAFGAGLLIYSIIKYRWRLHDAPLITRSEPDDSNDDRGECQRDPKP